MTDCTFQRDPDAAAWVCTVCGYTYALDLARPPRRNCPHAPDNLRDRLARLARRIEEAVTDGTATRPWAEIGRLLARCQTARDGRPCQDFYGDACAVYDGCSRRDRYLALLTDCRLWCEAWGPREAADAEPPAAS